MQAKIVNDKVLRDPEPGELWRLVDKENIYKNRVYLAVKGRDLEGNDKVQLLDTTDFKTVWSFYGGFGGMGYTFDFVGRLVLED
jgi:hypothetical protein